jgi:predicted permease
MKWLKQLRWRRRHYDELAESIREHLEEKKEELMEAGMPAEQAERAARREFGNVTLIEECSREVWQWPRFETLLRDVRIAVRQLRRSPGFALTAVAMLALSVGPNTAIFSLVNALLLTRLPYPQPDRLGAIYARVTGSESSTGRINIDGEQWDLLREKTPSLLPAVSSTRTNGVNLKAGSQVRYLHAARISSRYFDVLGFRPLLGRGFSDAEDRAHGPTAAILSNSLWRSTFGADGQVLGRTVLLKGEPYTIVGVLPQNAVTPLNADIYTSLRPSQEGEGRSPNYGPIVRLRDGATWQQANAEVNRAWSDTRRARRMAQNGVQMTHYAVPLQQAQTDSLRPQVIALMLAAGSILLIACANLAGLTLVRLSRRTAEIATRIALGASRWQIQRQLWIENLVLAMPGGAAGIGIGLAGLRGLLLLLPEHFLPVEGVPLDPRVLGFTLAVSLFTSILFGMLPALAVRKADLRSAMSSRSVIGARSFGLREALIAGEVALTLVLLAGAGLLIRTLIHLETLPAGFNPRGVIAAKASVDDARYRDPASFRRLLDRSLDEMRRIPGVAGAAVTLTLPYERALLNAVSFMDGANGAKQVTTNWIYVTPGFFETLQLPILAGRAFGDSDVAGTQPVAIVNRAFARKFFHAGDPVGQYLDGKLRIVGVAADTVLSAAGRLNPGTSPLTSEETIYVPAAQIGDGGFLSMMHAWFQPSWIVRANGPLNGLPERMQRALASADPDLPFSGFYGMDDLMAATLATQRVEVALLIAMASLALALSAVGIFALVANVVARRTREIGIRIALGATIPGSILQIGKSGAMSAAAGMVLGLILAAGVLRAMRSVLYGVGVYDPPTILAVVLTLSVVAALATALPALRIAGIDPARTLRED